MYQLQDKWEKDVANTIQDVANVEQQGTYEKDSEMPSVFRSGLQGTYRYMVLSSVSDPNQYLSDAALKIRILISYSEYG